MITKRLHGNKKKHPLITDVARTWLQYFRNAVETIHITNYISRQSHNERTGEMQFATHSAWRPPLPLINYTMWTFYTADMVTRNRKH